MKLFSPAALVSVAASVSIDEVAEWQQPSYWDALTMAKSRNGDWGHPVGIRAAADWSMCPTLALPAGVASFTCNQSTCMAVCEAGKVSTGRRRIKCRWKRKKGFFWRRLPEACQGCNPEVPSSTDANVQFECSINAKNRTTCMARCGNGGKILGGKKLKLKCKCPRQSNGQKVCGWVGRKAFWDAATITGLTCEGGSSSSGSTGTSTGTGGGTSAGTGTATHCPNSTTVITSTGVTCADGSTPVSTGTGGTATGDGSTATTAATAATTMAAPVTTAPAAAATTAAAGATTAAAGATTAAAGATTAAAGATTAAAGATTAAAGATTAAVTTAAPTTAAPSGTGWVPGNPEFEALTNTVSSGMTNCNPSGNRIVGGQTATEGSWPWIANVFLRHTGDTMGAGCGGTVIGDKWVLTAAHCCWDSDTQTLFSESVVKFNEHDEQATSANEFSLTSTNLFPHPSYVSCPSGAQTNASGQTCTQNFDVCLLKFDTSIFASDTSNSVQAACLAQAEPTHGRACWVAGWGATSENGQSATVLQEVGVNVFSDDYCIANTDQNGTPASDEFCAAKPDGNSNGLTDAGTDSCQGDSGGPLLCNVAGVATLTGVVSHGPGCAREGGAGVYGDVFHFKDWIEQTIADNA